jgi:hypothetical protein
LAFVAEMVAEPSPAATASPLLLTRMTAEFDVDHVIVFPFRVDSFDVN